MDFWTAAKIYAIVSLALAGTSYYTLYKPSIELAEEIVGRDLPFHSGWLGTILWFLMSGLMSPWTIFVLLSNDNNKFIESFALKITEIVEEE